jgi:hypothetical protein
MLEGDNGDQGAAGKDAPQGLTMQVIARTVLNPEDPDGAAEIFQYHADTQMAYAINSAADEPTVEVIDLTSLSSEPVDGPLNANNLNTSSILLETNVDGKALNGANILPLAMTGWL